MAISEKHLQFIDELFKEGNAFNATQAYLNVYDCSVTTANSAPFEIMRRPDVSEEIARRQALLRQKNALQADDILQELFLVASADPRDLIEYYRGACRHCHGVDFKYQRTPAEFNRELKAYLSDNALLAKKGKVTPDPLGLAFDTQGGIGFTPRKRPEMDCPECFGEGVGYTYVKDTRTLSRAAARLYCGVKQTRDGIEIKMRSPDKALELAGQHLGLFKTGLQISGPDGGAIKMETTSLPVDPIQAAKIYQDLISK